MIRRLPVLGMLTLLCWACACAPVSESETARSPAQTVITISGSEVGDEAELLELQLDRFMERHPGIHVERYYTPDDADQRHQLYVQWLDAGVGNPDVLQLDVVRTAEFAAAGWILPLERFDPEADAFFPGVVEANVWQERLYALPWFVDVGMLYWRTDLLDAPPATFEELVAAAEGAAGTSYGFVWQGARYEGLVCVFLEHLGGFGGRILDDDGRVVVDSTEAVRALEFMRDSLHRTGLVPQRVLTWHEEETRRVFQSGDAVFMRNWPYAYPLMQSEEDSEVVDRFAVAAMPATAAGEATATLGGQQLAINAASEHPEVAYALIAYLTHPEQMRERARVLGHYPPRPALYDDPAIAEALAIPPEEARRVIEHAQPRPVTPVYAQLSEILQVWLHRALTRQVDPEQALSRAAREMRDLLGGAEREDGLADQPAPGRGAPTGVLVGAAAGFALLLLVGWLAIGRPKGAARVGLEARDARLARWFLLPAIGTIVLIAIFPLLWTFWDSLHDHDLRMPWRGRPFVGLENYERALGDARFWAAMGHTGFFTAVSVAGELTLGLILALALNRAFRGRGLVRAAVLVPWAIPTVVAALVWRFLFDPYGWLSETPDAWLPIILADVWKTTPFAALLLLAGLQNIDDELYEAARIDGAGPVRQFLHVTLPLLKPAILVTLIFRTLDAFRVFDLIYALTGGGPGTATEPISLYTFNSLFQYLQFGFGSALSVIIFVVTFLLAMLYIRVLGADLTRSVR